MKWMRTYHLPWSPGVSNDDKIMKDVSGLTGGHVVVTEKLDGETTVLSRDIIHARSPDKKYGWHWSHSKAKSWWAMINMSIPLNTYIICENIYAVHSISYIEKIEPHLYVFAVVVDDIILPFSDTVSFAEKLFLPHVPILYDGRWSKSKVIDCYTKSSMLGGEQEGYVVRSTSKIKVSDWGYCAGKYVRENHVQQGAVHWSKKRKNQLL